MLFFIYERIPSDFPLFKCVDFLILKIRKSSTEWILHYLSNVGSEKKVLTTFYMEVKSSLV